MKNAPDRFSNDEPMHLPDGGVLYPMDLDTQEKGEKAREEVSNKANKEELQKVTDEMKKEIIGFTLSDDNAPKNPDEIVW